MVFVLPVSVAASLCFIEGKFFTELLLIAIALLLAAIASIITVVIVFKKNTTRAAWITSAILLFLTALFVLSIIVWFYTLDEVRGYVGT